MATRYRLPIHRYLLLLLFCVVRISSQTIGSSLTEIRFKTGISYSGRRREILSLSVNWNGTTFDCLEYASQLDHQYTCFPTSNPGTRNPSIEYYVYVVWHRDGSPLQITEFTFVDDLGSTYTIQQFCHPSTMQCTLDRAEALTPGSMPQCNQWGNKYRYDTIQLGSSTKFGALYIDIPIFGSRFANQVIEGGVRPPNLVRAGFRTGTGSIGAGAIASISLHWDTGLYRCDVVPNAAETPFECTLSTPLHCPAITDFWMSVYSDQNGGDILHITSIWFEDETAATYSFSEHFCRDHASPQTCSGQCTTFSKDCNEIYVGGQFMTFIFPKLVPFFVPECVFDYPNNSTSALYIDVGAGSVVSETPQPNEFGWDTAQFGGPIDAICPETPEPTYDPTRIPTADPTYSPSIAPTNAPSNAPSIAPTAPPTNVPSSAPSVPPTIAPSNAPSSVPSIAPSSAPTDSPSYAPSHNPSMKPSVAPTNSPFNAPTSAPSIVPTYIPSISPTNAPSIAPSNTPSIAPTNTPSIAPSVPPTNAPSAPPTITPSDAPSSVPTIAPSSNPTISPFNAPSSTPSVEPSSVPTNSPSDTPSSNPSIAPSSAPTNPPSSVPSISPSLVPTISPSNAPSSVPSIAPTHVPSVPPTHNPSIAPIYTNAPSTEPTNTPSVAPSSSPTNRPSSSPTSHPSRAPSRDPTQEPTTFQPTEHPTLSSRPPTLRSRHPTLFPTHYPTSLPTNSPTEFPSASPTYYPTYLPTFDPFHDTTTTLTFTSSEYSVLSSEAATILGICGVAVTFICCIGLIIVLSIYSHMQQVSNYNTAAVIDQEAAGIIDDEETHDETPEGENVLPAKDEQLPLAYYYNHGTLL